MDRVAVFVDAGYVFAQGSALLAGRKLSRSEIVLDHEAAAQAFAGFAERVSGNPLLRIYWYDGTSTYEWSEEDVTKFLTCRQKQPAGPAPARTPKRLAVGVALIADPLEILASKIAQTLEKSELIAMVEAFEATRQLPRDVDRRLLGDGRTAIKRDLDPTEKKRVRGSFVTACRLRLAD